MKCCIKCGQWLDDVAIICPSCATLQTEGLPTAPPGGTHAFDPLGGGLVPRRKPAGATAYMVWSIALILLGSLVIGIVSFMFSMTANSIEDYNKAHEYTRRARNACIIETVVLAVLVLAYIIIRMTRPSLLGSLTGTSSG